ncbi:MAG: ferrous iron transporter B [Hyphomonas sp.]|uniref:ferrous iron transporter B n=1 Tax=Hyphomonas sp. TaxID=87 RepID=UPI00182B1647|nr:ferrous iron transporter B [Hyphomonas sp.]MBA3067551.1 ferrous iron transporter B [Hyphomonas sp.]MBU3918996.1 ferrous iron transporter B [Alphaproteobacteria bacterium]MBU4063439.1 ferrous iron transporter B [Alphaproteobacteria bacterium]MBU4165260.1 ferrous iron transporter B [Alphaproteobacteria bacterium]
MTALRFALVGAPNCGKSTLFNGLTGGRAKTANYAGVTVERRSGRFTTPKHHTIELLDLPGINGLSSRSLDERISVDTILGRNADETAPAGLLVVIDSGDIRTQLHFILQVRALGKPMILALNMYDLAERDGVKIDIGALERRLGVPVVATRATRASGREALLARLDELIGSGTWMTAPAPQSGKDIREFQREAREIAREVILAEPAMNRMTRVIDRVVLHKLAGPVVLALLLFLMFQAVFAWAAAPMNAIDSGISSLSAWLSSTMPDTWLRSLLTDGVIAGVGSVVIFLPQIVILFAFILLLEASGYMARAAFLMDELMLRVGLNGRAFIPLLSSFACAIPGMMAARTIENERDRLTTIMIAPLMTCSARLPVYTLIIAAFIPPTRVGPFGLQGVVMFGLYVMGIVSAVTVAFVLKRTLTKGPPQALLMELPTYKAPDLKDFLINLSSRAWAFLKRSGGVIFTVSVVLWFLASYPETPDGIRGSFAGVLGGLIEPVLRPIGFNLEIAIALVPGLAAREVAVGALGTVYALQGTDEQGLAAALQASWSLPTALSFLAWYVYAPQCVASLAVAKRETNSWRWTGVIIAYLFAMAYIAAGITFWAATAAGL